MCCRMVLNCMDVLACGCLKVEEVFHGGKVRGLHVFGENQLSYNGFIGSRKALLKSILLHSFVVPAETHISIERFRGVDNAPLQHIAIQRFILIFYGVVLVLIAVSTTVFFPVCPPLL
jgi:hypothetical protein